MFSAAVRNIIYSFNVHLKVNVTMVVEFGNRADFQLHFYRISYAMCYSQKARPCHSVSGFLSV